MSFGVHNQNGGSSQTLLLYIYASPSSGDAYSDRHLTPNYASPLV